MTAQPDLGLVADILDSVALYTGVTFNPTAIREQARLCREADNATGDAVTVNRSPAGEGGLPPERVEDDKDWAFIERCKNECGASYDDGDDGIFWTFDLAAMKKLRRLATPEQPGSVPDAETMRLHMGELSTDEVRIAQAAYRWAMSGSAVQGEVAGTVKYSDGMRTIVDMEKEGLPVGTKLYTTPPPAPAAEQGQCNHDEADVCPKCELRWRSLTERPAATQPEARGVEGSCEDPRLKAAGYYVCGSNANREWHFRRPSGEWRDRFRSEEAAVDAALREIAATPNPVRAEWLDIPTFLRRDATPEEHAAWEAKRAEQPEVQGEDVEKFREQLIKLFYRHSQIGSEDDAALADKVIELLAPAAPGAAVGVDALTEQVCAEVARRNGLAWPDGYDHDEQKDARESVGDVLKIAAALSAKERA